MNSNMQNIKKIDDTTFMLKVRIPIPALKFVNCYVIKKEENVLLIDTGWDSEESYASLLNNLNELNVKIRNIKGIIITHLHIDHLGLVTRINKNNEIPVFIHEEDWKYIRDTLKESDKKVNELRELLRKAGAPSELYNNIENLLPWIKRIKLFQSFIETARPVKDMENIIFNDHELEIIWTPGHTLGHICVYDKSSKNLFTGDHVLPKITPNISTYDFSRNLLKYYIKSLNKINKFEASTILPAHEYEFKSLKNRIFELKLHHLERIKEIIEIIKNGFNTPYEIALKIKWNLGGKNLEQTDTFQKYMALGETFSHLIFLKTYSILKEEEDSSSLKYYLNENLDYENILKFELFENLA